jgi:hypothetical protein
LKVDQAILDGTWHPSAIEVPPWEIAPSRTQARSGVLTSANLPTLPAWI